MINKYLTAVGLKSKIALKSLNNVNIKKRNKVLQTYNKELLKNTKKILKENVKDLKTCKRQELVDRLIMDKKRIEAIRESINQII